MISMLASETEHLNPKLAELIKLSPSLINPDQHPVEEAICNPHAPSFVLENSDGSEQALASNHSD